jgi:LysM repeat protein
MGDYVVKEGDSYAKIAAQSGMDPRLYIELMHHNNSKRLRPGDVIDLPGASTLQSESNRILQGKGQASKYKAPGAAGPLGVGQQGNTVTAPGTTWNTTRPLPTSVQYSTPLVPNLGHNFGAINTQSPAIPTIGHNFGAINNPPPVQTVKPRGPMGSGYATPEQMRQIRAREGLSPLPVPTSLPVMGSGYATPDQMRNARLISQGITPVSPPSQPRPPIMGAGYAPAEQMGHVRLINQGIAPAPAGQTQWPSARPPHERLGTTGTDAMARALAIGKVPAYIPVKGEAPIIPGSNDIRLSLGAWAASHPGVPKPQWAQDLDPANMQSWIDKRAAHSGGWIGGLNGTGGTIPQLPEGGVGNYYYSNPYGSYSYRGGYGGGGGGGGGASVPGGIVWRIGLS